MTETRKAQLHFVEWDLFAAALNEVTNAFPSRIGNFESVIGMPRPELVDFLHYLRRLPESAVVELDRRWILVFQNSLSSALQHMGESEFETRTGHEPAEARKILLRLGDLARSLSD